MSIVPPPIEPADLCRPRAVESGGKRLRFMLASSVGCVWYSNGLPARRAAVLEPTFRQPTATIP
jgi:hypothetical protein